MGDILKAVIIATLIAGAVFLVLFFSISYIVVFSKLIPLNYEWSEKSIDFWDFNKDPDKYLGKKVAAQGKFRPESEFYIECNKTIDTLTDEDGYFIKVCGNNEELEKGKTYTLKGKIVKDISNVTKAEGYLLKVI